MMPNVLLLCIVARKGLWLKPEFDKKKLLQESEDDKRTSDLVLYKPLHTDLLVADLTAT